MFILFKIVFHVICTVGRFFRKIGHVIVGRRHEEPGLFVSKTEPVTLEHIRIISDMENDSYRPPPSFSLVPKVHIALVLFHGIMVNLSSLFSFLRVPPMNGTPGVEKTFFDKNPSQWKHLKKMSIISVI